MPVQFQLEKDKPLTTFRYTVKSAQALEQEGGANPSYLAHSGKQVLALVLMLKHAIDDPAMNETKAQRLLQRYIDNGGKTKALMDALAKAMNESGIYGDPDDSAEPTDDEESAPVPT